MAFTQPARHVWVLAQKEAERLHHRYVGPEHLLLGLLATLGIDSVAVRRRLRETFGTEA